MAGLVFMTITDDGLDIDIGAGTHGADCASITEGFATVGTILEDGWRPEPNCTGNCNGCALAFLHQRNSLRGESTCQHLS